MLSAITVTYMIDKKLASRASSMLEGCISRVRYVWTRMWPVKTHDIPDERESDNMSA